MNLILVQLQKVWDTVSGLLTAKLFTIAEKEISLAFGIELLLSLAIAYLIARAIKVAIKHFMLTRLNIDRGSVESLSSIIGYVITTLALFIVLQIFGIGLSSLTVFAGALGIGFGIGLQDLASNFISGITILLERPIKVGDFIQIDDVEGTVDNISIRATTVLTEDGIYAIVPNKRFLENNVINWNFKEQQGRIHLPIDIPDDSDPLVVAEALGAAARRDPRVLASPPPEIHFKGFKDGMDFELLIWITDMIKREDISSTVYFMIEEELRMRGIKRTVPRRKLYFDTGELAVKIQGLPAGLVANGNGAAGVAAAPAETPDSPPENGKSSRPPALADLLRKVSYFANCNDMELRHIIMRGYRKSLKPDEVICKEGDPGDSFYIILSGQVEVFVESIGKRVAVRTGGEFIGEISLLMGTPRTAMLRTLEETVLFVVDRENLQTLLQKFPTLADKMSEELANRQDSLEKLGIKVTAATKDEPPLAQIRNRIKSLFGI